MGEVPERGRNRQWLQRNGARALIAGVFLAGGMAVGSAFHVTPVLALTSSCEVTAPVTVHYQLGTPGSGPPSAISLVGLTGFPAGCNGSTVKLEISGNSAGDPSTPATGDTLLSTADSTRDPCSQATLASPRVVAAGAIDLPLCATGGAATYVSVHDITLLSLFVNGTAASVGGVAGIGTTVPATGLAQQLFNGLFGLGLGLLVVGVFALGASAISRRRLR